MSYLITFILSILLVILMRIQSSLMPKSYFYYSRLIDGLDESGSIFGLLFRTSIPILVGFLTSVIAVGLALPEQYYIYSGMVGFLGIFLVIWPDIAHPELLRPQFALKKGKLFFLYFLLLITFTGLGLFGGFLGGFVYNQYPEITSLFDMRSIFNNLIATLIWWVTGAFVLSNYAKSFGKTS